MKMFDFSDSTFVMFFSAMCGLLLLLLIVVLTFTISFHKSKVFFTKVKNAKQSTRIFSIDVKRNKVVYFSKSSIRHKKEINLVTFYNHFHQNDSDKIKNWIFNICVDDKAVVDYLEVDVMLSKTKQCYSLLKLLKYNKETGIIHLESHLLKYISPINNVSKKRRGLPMGVVKRSTISGIISHNRALRGYTFAIRFFYIKEKAFSNDKIEKFMILTLKNEVYPFANDTKFPRQILETNENELILFDTHILNSDDAMHLANCIEHNLKRCIGVNGFSERVNFAIGVIENYQYYQDFDAIISKAQETCISAQTSGQNVLLYQKSVNHTLEMNKYSVEIDKLLEDGNLRYLFRPIIDAKEHEVIGFFEYVKGYNTPFTSFMEMSKYAAMVGKNRELFAVVSKYVITKFIAESNNKKLRLFFPVSLSNLDHMFDVLPQIADINSINLVLMFDEQEINENSQQYDIITSSLKRFKLNGYELGLLMKDKNLLLSSEFYYLFDYFIAGASMIGEIRRNNHIRLSIHTLIESLLKYGKPIIATDLEGWSSIELIIKSGITTISSESVSPSNDMLIPIEKKKLDKLFAMEDSFK